MSQKPKYDLTMYNNAWKKRKSDPQTALIELEEYINTFPDDILAQIAYAELLIILGRLEEAEMVLNNIEKLLIRAREGGQIDKNTLDKDERNYLEIKIRFYGFAKKFQDLYNLYKSKYNIFKWSKSDEVFVAACWAKRELGYPTHGPKHYKYNQIRKYDPTAFRRHIEKHLSPRKESQEETVEYPSFFVKGFPIEKVLAAIKKEIPSDKVLNDKFPYCKYVFKYQKCGVARDKDGNSFETNYFVVFVHHATAEFITMHPAKNEECSSLPQVDLSYLAYEDEAPVSPLCRRLASTNGGRIDRFNKRFGLK